MRNLGRRLAATATHGSAQERQQRQRKEQTRHQVSSAQEKENSDRG
jgi:hypothetical protein